MKELSENEKWGCVRPRRSGRAIKDRKIFELSENQIQKAVFDHLRRRGYPEVFAFHAKNGNSDMRGRGGGIYAGLGVTPGIPDVMILAPHPDHPWLTKVFALELKRESRRGTNPVKYEMNQIRCREILEKCGVFCGISYGLDEALTWLEERGLLRGEVK
jgi:hypothetical protein